MVSCSDVPQTLCRMQFHNSPLVVGALLAVASVGLTGARNGIQAVQRNQDVPFQDADLDGLDNALEYRLGSNPQKANADADALDDLTELVLGTDPDAPDGPASLPSPAPRVKLEAYVIGDALVLQNLMLRENSVKNVHFYVALPDPAQPANPSAPPVTQRLGINAYSKYVDRFATLPSAVPGYEISSMRLVLPSAPFLQAERFSIAVVAELDRGVKVADEIRFTTIDGMLVEWRDTAVRGFGSANLLQGGTTSGGQPGGLFPADPTANRPIGENLVNQVCVQQVGAVGLHGIGVMYGVLEADCDTLFGAVCFTSCTSSGGQTFFGLDLPSLLQ